MSTNPKNKPIFLVVKPTKKICGCQYWSAKWVLCKLKYFRRQWLTFSYILSGFLKIIINAECYLQYLPELPQQPDKKKKQKKNMVMKTYKERLGTCIK